MNKKFFFINLCFATVFVWTFSIFKEHVLIPYTETINFSAKIFSRLVLLSLLSPVIINMFVLLEVFGLYNKEQMALKYRYTKWFVWTTTIVSTIAFSVIVFIVCCNMESVVEKIGVLFSAIFLFASNLSASAWLLTKKDT